MKFKDIYKKAVKVGMDMDPRGKGGIEKVLARAKKDYDAMSKWDQERFDMERLTNPYSDTRMLYGDPDTEVKSVMIGIDIESAEVVLADRLRERGRPVDLIIAHHPEGQPLANLYDVMEMQSGILGTHGVPIGVAESIMSSRIKEVKANLMPANHNRAVDAARLLDIPMMCIHTPTDNAVTTHLQRSFDKEKPMYVGDVLEMLHEIPEYAMALGEAVGPNVLIGSERRTAGKVFVDMTGGTGGSKDAYERLAHAGVGTVVGMHIGPEHRKEAEKHHLNVVIAGHISSDSLGINLLLDKVLNKDIEVIECSGFRRISHKAGQKKAGGSARTAKKGGPKKKR